MREAEVLCLPSRWESCPYTALEAMAEGRAVVASEVDGLDEIVEHDRTGLLVAPENPAALASALDALAEERERCAELGRRGHERAARLFTLERMGAQTAAGY